MNSVDYLFFSTPAGTFVVPVSVTAKVGDDVISIDASKLALKDTSWNDEVIDKYSDRVEYNVVVGDAMTVKEYCALKRKLVLVG